MLTAPTGDPGTPTAFEAASGTGWLVEMRGTQQRVLTPTRPKATEPAHHALLTDRFPMGDLHALPARSPRLSTPAESAVGSRYNAVATLDALPVPPGQMGTIMAGFVPIWGYKRSKNRRDGRI
jgi:hypothetical protein